MLSIKFIFVRDSIPKHKYMYQCGLHLNLEFKGFSINKMTRASNYQIRSNGCNYIQTCHFVGIVNWLITTCVLSFGNYLLFDNSAAKGRGKHGCKLSCNCII